METPTNADGIRQRTNRLLVSRRDEKLSFNDGPNAPDATETVAGGAAEAEHKDGKKQKKTYGQTPDGTVFLVPETHDMVSQLLSPVEPKNLGDIFILSVLAIHILFLWILPASLRAPVFGVIYLAWRSCYNGGIGYLLHEQSKYKRLVVWAKRLRLFVDPATGDNPRPWLYRFMQRDFEIKIPNRAEYTFATAPLEYNTWLLFRRIVDLILMCDFVSYCLFAIACAHRPEGETLVMGILRWALGWLLFGFNLWVKLDAHRVVKDYAWYWGDFFFLLKDQDLTFDGVFEMAPHPMYSVGYAGYYGFSLMAGSYPVLFISIVAHAAQFAFLIWVENPHIQKTYNSPPAPQPARKDPLEDDGVETGKDLNLSRQSGNIGASSAAEDESDEDDEANDAIQHPSKLHNLLGIQNIDLCRVTDTSVFLLQFYLAALTLLTPSSPFYQALFILQAAGWRLWYSVGLGFILHAQSKRKRWIRHFVKFGDSPHEAWRQWKGLYHLSMTMAYASFVAACWKMSPSPREWDRDMVLLRYVLGAALVALQVWTSISIYDSLGEFGWFYGDFFFAPSAELTRGGIYRFLNNPERVIGSAGLWGAAIATSSSCIFLLALLSHALSIAFIHFVERPHMIDLYGPAALRQDSGLTRSLKRSLPPRFRQWSGSVDKLLDEAVDFVEELVEQARPRLAEGVGSIVRDTTALFKHPARISILPLEPDVVGFEPRDYSLELALDNDEAKMMSASVMNVRSSSRDADSKAIVMPYGSPLRVRWTAPLNHTSTDWIGLYMVASNPSRTWTAVSSAGRWIATTPDQYDIAVADEGILVADVRVHAPLPDDEDQPMSPSSPLSNVVGGSSTSGSSKKKACARSNSPREQPPRECFSGEVVFRGDKLWWSTGVFELRYHHRGGHVVMAMSRPFEVRIERFDNDEDDDPTASSTGVAEESNSSTSDAASCDRDYEDGRGRVEDEDEMQSRVERALLPVVARCFERGDGEANVVPLTTAENYAPFIEREGKFAKRVVYAVKHMFGIEFAPEVVQADGSIRNLAWRICNAKKVLAPYSMSHSDGKSTPSGKHRSRSRRP